MQYDIVDQQEVIAQQQIAGHDTTELRETLVDTLKRYTDLATKCNDEYAALMLQVERISTTRNAQAVDDMIKDRYHQPDCQVQALLNYLQNLCTHEEVDLVSRGSFYASQGEATDDIEEFLECRFCGKEVTNGANLQDGPELDF